MAMEAGVANYHIQIKQPIGSECLVLRIILYLHHTRGDQPIPSGWQQGVHVPYDLCIKGL